MVEDRRDARPLATDDGVEVGESTRKMPRSLVAHSRCCRSVSTPIDGVLGKAVCRRDGRESRHRGCAPDRRRVPTHSVPLPSSCSDSTSLLGRPSAVVKMRSVPSGRRRARPPRLMAIQTSCRRVLVNPADAAGECGASGHERLEALADATVQTGERADQQGAVAQPLHRPDARLRQPVALCVGSPSRAVRRAQSALGADPQRPVGRAGHGPHAVAGQAVTARERAHCAVRCNAVEAAAVGADPHGALPILVQPEDAVGREAFLRADRREDAVGEAG